MKIQPQRILKYYRLKFERLRGDPHFLAVGFGVGVFIGITPTIPLHTILALLFAFLLRGSKIAALLATILVSNPLTFVLQYYFSWEIGAWLTGTDLCWDKIGAVVEYITTDAGFRESITALADLGGEAIYVLLLGGTLLALPFTIIGYFVSFFFFKKIRDKRRKQHILN